MSARAAAQFAQLEDEIWGDMDEDERNDLLDPVVAQLAKTADALQTVSARIGEANVDAIKSLAEVLDDAGKKLKDAHDGFTGRDIADAIGKLATEQERQRKTMTSMFELQSIMVKELKELKAAYLAPKRIQFDANGKPVGVKVG